MYKNHKSLKLMQDISNKNLLCDSHIKISEKIKSIKKNYCSRKARKIFRNISIFYI